MRLCLAIFLTIHGVTDGKSGYIYLPVIWVQMAIGVMVAVWDGYGVEMLLLRLLPGIAVFFVSRISGERIGRGDAWLLTATGLYLGLWQQLCLWCCASMLSFLWTMWRMVAGRVDKNKEIVLAPFLWLGYLGGLCVGWF